MIKGADAAALRNFNSTQQIGPSFQNNFGRTNNFDATSKFSAGKSSTITNKKIGGLARRQIARQYTQEEHGMQSTFNSKYDIGKTTGFLQHQRTYYQGIPNNNVDLNKNFQDIIMSQENLK